MTTKLWTPKENKYPPFDSLEEITVENLCSSIKDDVILRDAMLFPRSWKPVPFQRIILKAINECNVIFIQVGRGGTKCLGWDEEITLSNGKRVKANELIGKSFEIPSLINGDKILKFVDKRGNRLDTARNKAGRTPLPVFKNGEAYVDNATAFASDNGLKDTYQVKTSCGVVVERTGNHPLLTHSGWTKVKDLKKGDRIAAATRTTAHGSVPMDENELKFLAYILADGGCGPTSAGVTFTQMNGAQLDEFREVCTALGIEPVPMSKNCGPENIQYRMVNAGARKHKQPSVARSILEKHGVMGKHSRDKRIPEAIFNAPNEQVALFLSRFLGCDGWASVDYSSRGIRNKRPKPSVGCGLISKGMVKDIRDLALRLGVKGSYHENICLKSTSDGKSWTWRVSGVKDVIRFAENIGIFGKEKKVQEVYEVALESVKAGKGKHEPNPDFCWSTVESVTYLGRRRTVNIEVPIHHTFVTNLIEHNSSSVSRAVLGESFSNKINVVYTGPTFRQALLPWDYTRGYIEENSGANLPFGWEREVDGKITISNLKAKIKLKNGSKHVALPMGDGKKLRGERAHILICDEMFDIERDLFNLHIVPFLLRPVVEGGYRSKLIMMTSAEAADCYAYHFLTTTMLPKVREGNIKYCVLDIRAQDVIASGITLEPDIAAMLMHNTGGNPEERDRLLYNKWTALGGQFFPANLTQRMESPIAHVEHKRMDKNCQYGLAIDVASSPTGDNFVIQTCKFPGQRQMHIVNSYWARGLSIEEMAWKIHQYNDRFDPTWIVMDKGGGGTHVASALSKRKLVMRDNTIKEITNPILFHDEIGAISGQRKLILNKPTDEMVRTAFAGDRQRGGEYINSEDIFIHLMYDGLKNLIAQEDCPIKIPLYGGEEGDEDNSDAEIVDKIQQSVRELRALTYKYQMNPDGTKLVVRSKIHRVPMYTWKSSNKDGAVSLAYAYILYNLIYPSERGGDFLSDGPISEEVRMDGSGQIPILQPGQLEREPGRLFNGLTGKFQ